MNTRALQQVWYEDAKFLLLEAHYVFQQQQYHRVVRLCQESIELALKSLLLFCGVDAPKEHNLTKPLERLELVKHQVPKDQRRRLLNIANSLPKRRIVSFYGSREGIPARDLFSETDAQQALDDAAFVLKLLETLTFQSNQERYP